MKHTKASFRSANYHKSLELKWSDETQLDNSRSDKSVQQRQKHQQQHAIKI
jgi:hypothetical protein